ncbi:MAG: DNA-binding protein [Spirochaetia bacterium]|nr:DNA-binding protein [Spirochaetia bacterium]
MDRKYVRIDEVAKYTSVSTYAIRKYVLEKKIPYIKVNGCLLFNLADIDAWLEKSRVTPLQAHQLKAVRV